MRVLVMISGLPMGGAERNAVALVEELRKRGVAVALATLNRQRDSALARAVDAAGIERIDLGMRRLIDPLGWIRLVRLVRRRKYDLLHTEDQYSNILGGLMRLLRVVRVVMSRHVLAEPQTSLRDRVRARLAILAAAYGSDRVIAVSDAVARALARQSGLHRDRISVIRNGIDLQCFDAAPTRVAARVALGWPVDGPVATMVGVLRPGKGHGMLLAALPAVLRSVPDARIMIVGDGPLRAELAASAAGFPVEFLGERSDIPSILAATDVVVLPSTGEGLPNILLEAGAAGRVAVATAVGGIGEVIEDGMTGFLVPEGDIAAFARRVAQCLADRPTATTLGQAARRKIEAEFTLAGQARATLALYESVVAGR